MNEVKFYSALLLATLIAAYMSWTHEADDTSENAVTLVDLKPEELTGLRLQTKTQTIAVARKDVAGDAYWWIETQQGAKESAFTASEKIDELTKLFAPFKAIRSLGVLDADKLERTGLAKSGGKLILRQRDGDTREFILGGATTGAGDQYAQAAGSQEVVLLAARLMNDLKGAERRFMQRALRESKLADVTKVTLTKGKKSKTFFHKNRLSPKDAFWATEAEPDKANETVGNYVSKLDRLLARSYLAESEGKDAVEQVKVKWFGENDKDLGTLTVSKKGEEKDVMFIAHSETTRVPVKITTSAGERVVTDIETVLAD